MKLYVSQNSRAGAPDNANAEFSLPMVSMTVSDLLILTTVGTAEN